MDLTEQLTRAIIDAGSARRRLWIAGSGSKRDWYDIPTGVELMSVVEHAGVIDYQPDELFITARGGTPLKAIELALDQRNQSLAFEPPRLFSSGTVGGAVASGLSGPGRAWNGALRDAVLGVEIINGLGEQLVFGGQVMKNVAGYDVSRLNAGAFGGLGVMLNVSLRVRPTPLHEATVAFAFDADRAIQFCRSLARQNLPVSGTCWMNDMLYIRLSGSEVAVAAAFTKLGGDRFPAGSLWRELRDQQHPFFKASSVDVQRDTDSNLWRVIVPAAVEMPAFAPRDTLMEWGGGLRWIWHTDEAEIAQYAAQVGGWYWGRGKPLSIEESQRALMLRIKAAFDPHNVFYSPLYGDVEYVGQEQTPARSEAQPDTNGEHRAH